MAGGCKQQDCHTLREASSGTTAYSSLSIVASCQPVKPLPLSATVILSKSISTTP